MRHFWIAYIIFLLAAALLGHGILTVWMRHVQVEKYRAETDRLEFIDYACMGIQEGRGRAFVLGDQIIKCSEVKIDYVPSKEKVSLL